MTTINRAEIKAQHPDKMMLFRMGDYYEIYGDDAEVAAKNLNLTVTLTCRGRGWGGHSTLMVGIPVHASERYIETLAEAGFRCATVDAVGHVRDCE